MFFDEKRIKSFFLFHGTVCFLALGENIPSERKAKSCAGFFVFLFVVDFFKKEYFSLVFSVRIIYYILVFSLHLPFRRRACKSRGGS